MQALKLRYERIQNEHGEHGAVRPLGVPLPSPARAAEGEGEREDGITEAGEVSTSTNMRTRTASSMNVLREGGLGKTAME